MPEVQHNLLSEAIFTVVNPNNSRCALSLPAVLARLSEGAAIEFAALQPHQSHAWYSFLVQLAAIAAHHTAAESFDRNEGEWLRAVQLLTGGLPEPWCLVVDDLSKPAFMQPPVPEGSLATWKNATTSPDELDLLVTAKNHDLKARRIWCPRAEHWVYALISLQTMEGFGGRKNYGVARMNGGYGNRPCIAVAGDAGWGTRFKRDVLLLLQNRASLVEKYVYRDRGGHELLWLLPWNGASALSLSDCDPIFIEICRRARLTEAEGSIRAHWIGSDTARIDAKERKGDTGDLWTPVRREDGAGLTAKNLSYDILQQVLFGAQYSPSLASQSRSEDGTSPVVIAQVLTRGQGVTEGFHERLIPVPAKSKGLFSTPEGRTMLGKLAGARVELVARIRKEVLRPAILTLLQAAPDQLDFQDDRTGSFTRALDSAVDGMFFEQLFEDVERDRSETDRDFTARVLDLAQSILRSAMESVPLPTLRRYRAITRAERVFTGAARKRFPDVYATKEGGRDEQSAAG